MLTVYQTDVFVPLGESNIIYQPTADQVSASLIDSNGTAISAEKEVTFQSDGLIIVNISKNLAEDFRWIGLQFGLSSPRRIGNGFRYLIYCMSNHDNYLGDAVRIDLNMTGYEAGSSNLAEVPILKGFSSINNYTFASASRNLLDFEPELSSVTALAMKLKWMGEINSNLCLTIRGPYIIDSTISSEWFLLAMPSILCPILIGVFFARSYYLPTSARKIRKLMRQK